MWCGMFFIRGVVNGVIDIQQYQKDEELKKRIFHMNRRWSV